MSPSAPSAQVQQSAPGTDADVLIVGAGIAGACAAYCAARAGRRVTLVDDGRHRASDLPLALVNPVRGHTGRLVAGGVDGLHATFALIDLLRLDGHAIDAGRGLWRPLIDVAPQAREHAFWHARLGSSLAFDWHPVAPASLGLAAPVPALFLHDAGWIAPTSLLDALIAASGATVVRGRVEGLVPLGAATFAVRLAGHPRLVARSLLWCGGAFGASLLEAEDARQAQAAAEGGDPEADDPEADDPGADDRSGEGRADDDRARGLSETGQRRGRAARGGSLGALRSLPSSSWSSPSSSGSASYKPGSLLGFDAPLTDRPMSFGLYAAPWPPIRDGHGDASRGMARTLVGPTREGSQSTFPAGTASAEAIAHLGDRVAWTFGTTIAPYEAWRGVRLARLSASAATALAGIPTLTALGSRGFLMAPWHAAAWARSL